MPDRGGPNNGTKQKTAELMWRIVTTTHAGTSLGVKWVVRDEATKVVLYYEGFKIKLRHLEDLSIPL